MLAGEYLSGVAHRVDHGVDLGICVLARWRGVVELRPGCGSLGLGLVDDLDQRGGVNTGFYGLVLAENVIRAAQAA
jgi:hypothetical protein